MTCCGGAYHYRAAPTKLVKYAQRTMWPLASERVERRLWVFSGSWATRLTSSRVSPNGATRTGVSHPPLTSYALLFLVPPQIC